MGLPKRLEGLASVQESLIKVLRVRNNAEIWTAPALSYFPFNSRLTESQKVCLSLIWNLKTVFEYIDCRRIMMNFQQQLQTPLSQT